VLKKGRLNIKKFMQTKRHRIGMKLYLLCDYETIFVRLLGIHREKY
jgi:hypothetical protein